MASPGVMVSSLTFTLTAASLSLVILKLSQKLQHHQCLNSSMRIMLPWSDTPLQIRSKTLKTLPLHITTQDLSLIQRKQRLCQVFHLSRLSLVSHSSFFAIKSIKLNNLRIWAVSSLPAIICLKKINTQLNKPLPFWSPDASSVPKSQLGLVNQDRSRTQQSAILYCCETWTLYCHPIKALEAFYTHCLQNMLGIRWCHHVIHNKFRHKATRRLNNSNTSSLLESTDFQETVLSIYNIIKIFTSKNLNLEV